MKRETLLFLIENFCKDDEEEFSRGIYDYIMNISEVEYEVKHGILKLQQKCPHYEKTYVKKDGGYYRCDWCFKRIEKELP